MISYNIKLTMTNQLVLNSIALIALINNVFCSTEPLYLDGIPSISSNISRSSLTENVICDDRYGRFCQNDCSTLLVSSHIYFMKN